MLQGIYVCITSHLLKCWQAEMFFEWIILAFSPDVDSKTFKNIEILQADGPSRDGPQFYPLPKTAQIHCDVLSNNFALTCIEKQFLYYKWFMTECVWYILTVQLLICPLHRYCIFCNYRIKQKDKPETWLLLYLLIAYVSTMNFIKIKNFF